MSKNIYNNNVIISCPLVHDEDGYFHLVYQIINLVNGKIYIGKHTTKDPYDNYMGSGKAIKQAIEKYGIENFVKEILFGFYNENEAFLKEEEIVTQEFIDRDDTYNIVLGGIGMKSGEANPNFGKPKNQEIRDKISKSKKGKYVGEKNPMYGRRGENSPIFGEKNGMYGRRGEDNPMYGCCGEKHPMYGKHHTQEAKDKMSEAAKGKYVGEKNPMYGRRGENSPLYGKHLSEETRDKISKAMKGKLTGEKNPMYGKKRDENVRNKISNSLKGKLTGENNPRAKPILKIDVSGNIVAEYGCVKDCREQEHIDKRKLTKILKEHILYNGFFFEFKDKD